MKIFQNSALGVVQTGYMMAGIVAGNALKKTEERLDRLERKRS